MYIKKIYHNHIDSSYYNYYCMSSVYGDTSAACDNVCANTTNSKKEVFSENPRLIT